MSDTNNNKKKKPEFGFFSDKQLRFNKQEIFYVNMDDKIVQVTEVSYNEDTNPNFNDSIKLGKLKRHIPNCYIEKYGFKYEDFKDKMLE